MHVADERLIVALDFSTAEQAMQLVDILGDSVGFYKVGMQLYFSAGNTVLRALGQLGKRIFLDLKINDIPETVAKAVEAVDNFGVDYLTLFTGATQLRRAREIVERNSSKLKLLNVSVLTSEQSNVAAVKERAAMSFENGAHGCICSGFETAEIRKSTGDTFIIINPGIRLPENKSDDQIRIVTPLIAIQAGASHIVVGRPITQAVNPREVAAQITDQISLKTA